MHENTLERARIEARTIFEHNLAYRKWNTKHGGVYVKVDELTQPNPYLDIADRDLMTIGGQELTMINPFQMTREAYELLQENMDQPTYNRTVSHDNLNPINAPDEWETKALDSFVDGVEEISEVTILKSSPYLRLLKPYVAMEGCIKCHDGYTVGDIRGGMSIAVAMDSYYKSESMATNSIIVTHFFLWLIGVFSIGLLTRNIQTQQKKTLDSEEKFRILAEFSNDWEYWLSEDHQIVFMSPSCERITGYSQILSIKLGKDNPLQDKAEAILLAGRRASTLTNQLLAFSRKQVLEMRPMNLNKLILSLEDFLARLIGEHIQLEIKTDPGAGNIVADAVQIEQILMNLTVNGRDAMPNGGKILISTGETEIVHGRDKDTASIKPGAYAVLKVSDTGSGIPLDIQEKIFEPFFTTKPAGKGTGLGLATVFGVVTQHKGLLQLDSSPGKGASFTILLPKTDERPSDISVETKESPTLQQGTEMMLVVDDDHTICNLIADTLRPHGYTVLAATSGREALELLRSHRGEVDLLLTDVIMPEMNGRALSSAAKLIKPNIKILYMSGYTGNIIARHGLLENGVNLINKPLVPDKLLYKIREVLDLEETAALQS